MEFYISPQSGQFYMINVLENQWLSVTCTADIRSDVLKTDFLSTLCMGIAWLYIIQKDNTLLNSIWTYELGTW